MGKFLVIQIILTYKIIQVIIAKNTNSNSLQLTFLHWCSFLRLRERRQAWHQYDLLYRGSFHVSFSFINNYYATSLVNTWHCAGMSINRRHGLSKAIPNWYLRELVRLHQIDILGVSKAIPNWYLRSYRFLIRTKKSTYEWATLVFLKRKNFLCKQSSAE